MPNSSLSEDWLIIDAYFYLPTKLRWILENVEGCSSSGWSRRNWFWTVDSWLGLETYSWKETTSRISQMPGRTMLSISYQDWDQDYWIFWYTLHPCFLKVNLALEVYGETTGWCAQYKNPNRRNSGRDQQAALLPNLCTEPGMQKPPTEPAAF